ncbi:lipocalin-1-like, transcript variant X1 [Ictidomys tridecemlineatus]|uniref:lipocalin-1-like isoform X1 n=1 Tax=Ictidomys tridecemlineatus TaxID=43179 RepID=UPI00068026EF|nr:lipocalin-1-like isoform X1 [Ictidomys tridecemlineatus]KAG3288261.1 lipocalin-1-like, transcript variant X1 [Ictidomys tridecemlineatus]
MRLLLLTVGLSLLSVARAQKFLLTPASSQELLGDWHIVRWAGDLTIPEERKTHPLPPFKFVRNKLNKLEFRMNLMKPIGCIQFQMILDVASRGTFQTGWRHTISVHFLPGKDHAIAYFKGKIQQTYQMTMLMGVLQPLDRVELGVNLQGAGRQGAVPSSPAICSSHPGSHFWDSWTLGGRGPLPRGQLCPGRTLEEDPEALSIFEKFVKDKGLNKITAPPHLEACKLPRES